MKDKVICLSNVMSVEAIITAVIYSLSEAPAVVQKNTLLFSMSMQDVSFSITKKNIINFRLITLHCKMFGWILNILPKPIRTLKLLNLQRNMSV